MLIPSRPQLRTSFLLFFLRNLFARILKPDDEHVYMPANAHVYIPADADVPSYAFALLRLCVIRLLPFCWVAGVLVHAPLVLRMSVQPQAHSCPFALSLIY